MLSGDLYIIIASIKNLMYNKQKQGCVVKEIYMKKSMFVLLFFTASFTGVLFSQKATLTKNTRYYLEGTLANSPVTMELTFDSKNKKSRGYYFYNKVGDSIYLDGGITASALTLTETINDKVIGSLNGKFDSKKGTFVGKRKNAADDKEYDFSLSLSTNTKINKRYIYAYAYNDKKKFTREYEGVYEKNEYTFKTLISTTLLADNSGKNPVIDKINEDMNNGARGEKDIKGFCQEYIKEYLSDWNKDGGDYEIYYDIDVSYMDNKIISFNRSGYTYTGGAHGNKLIENRTYNIETGVKITGLSNLIKDANDKKLITLLRAKLIGSERNKQDYFDFDEIRLNDNFFIKKNGVSFLYNQYEIAPYYVGVVEVFFTFRELMPFLKNDSPFKYLF